MNVNSLYHLKICVFTLLSERGHPLGQGVNWGVFLRGEDSEVPHQFWVALLSERLRTVLSLVAIWTGRSDQSPVSVLNCKRGLKRIA